MLKALKFEKEVGAKEKHNQNEKNTEHPQGFLRKGDGGNLVGRGGGWTPGLESGMCCHPSPPQLTTAPTAVALRASGLTAVIPTVLSIKGRVYVRSYLGCTLDLTY